MGLRKLIVMLCLFPLAALAGSGEEELAVLRTLNWHVGPRVEQVVGRAKLATPNEDILFLDSADAMKFLQINGNPPAPGHNIVVSQSNKWWAAFSFDPIGYVKDDEKIDAAKLMKRLQESDGPANEERKRLGLSPITTEGWYVWPHYDPQSRRLEWGLKLSSDGETVLNYTIRILGRSGVINATLVSTPDALDKDVVSLKEVLEGLEFNPGERYAEFKEGDHVAEYGLAALIVGGAAAAATKKGFLGGIGAFFVAAWKLMLGLVVAVLAGLRGLLKKREF